MSESRKKAELKSFNKPDEVRTFPKGKVGAGQNRGAMVDGRHSNGEVVHLRAALAKTRAAKPRTSNINCRTLHIVMDDGDRVRQQAGDVALLPVGHDAWVVGNEPS